MAYTFESLNRLQASLNATGVLSERYASRIMGEALSAVQEATKAERARHAAAQPKLTGPRQAYPAGERVPIEIHGDTRQALNSLLFRREMRGVGYSEFINRAIALAEQELA